MIKPKAEACFDVNQANLMPSLLKKYVYYVSVGNYTHNTLDLIA
jgi:hypothetical protein